MTEIHKYIRYQEGTLTGSSIKKVDRQQIYISVINKIFQQGEVWHCYTAFG